MSDSESVAISLNLRLFDKKNLSLSLPLKQHLLTKYLEFSKYNIEVEWHAVKNSIS